MTTLVAIGIYYVPIGYKATGDFHGQTYSARPVKKNNIVIEGRNRNQSFETIIRNAPVLSVKRSRTPERGRWEIEFRTNLFNLSLKHI